MGRVLALLFLGTWLLAQELVQIHGELIEIDPSKIRLKAPFTLDYSGYHLEADRAHYDQNTSQLRLFGSLELLDGNGSAFHAHSGSFDLTRKRFRLDRFFLSQMPSKLWSQGIRLDGNESRLSLAKAFLSSCQVGCSDWRLYFGMGEYDRKREWVNLYNVAFYIGEIPIFYLPYIGFSTITRRHTGLLRPTIGLSNREGLVYIQPFFYAPTNWWDLELDPQIRTKRGAGLYGTFRFVDSPNSYGEIRTGFFKERERYREDHGIRHDKHYGLELYYRRRGLLGDQEEDGIYLDSKSYNDVDYFYLQKHSLLSNISSIIISRLNYFFQQGRNYFGLYAKYFKDNRKLDNDDTLQILPALQYHRFIQSVLSHNISYLVNAEVYHYTRKEGLNAIEYRFDMPIRIYTALFDDRLGLMFSENLNARYADYNFVDKNLNKKWKNYYAYRNSHQISIYSDLVRPYPTFLHTLHLDATLNIPSLEREGGDRAPFIDAASNEKSLYLTLKHYFYDKQGRERFYHRLTQPFIYDYPHKAKELENEFGFMVGGWEVNLDTFYSHQASKLVAIATQLHYQDDEDNLYLSHFYKDRLYGQRDSNYLRFDYSRTLSKRNRLFATIDYDFVDERTKSWSLGWEHRSQCWAYTISYKQDVIPVLTSTGSNSYNNNVIYFRIELYPLGGIARSISQSNEQRTF
ncbi:MAG: hypothetical protein C6I00_00725 [Nitratiruptor sp.]|nr:hypothetical protein [Nitratiruptor sp.]NPA83399.1 LPS-assembly protein LptD [Campylobacterota bacterium]